MDSQVYRTDSRALGKEFDTEVMNTKTHEQKSDVSEPGTWPQKNYTRSNSDNPKMTR